MMIYPISYSKMLLLGSNIIYKKYRKIEELFFKEEPIDYSINYLYNFKQCVDMMYWWYVSTHIKTSDSMRYWSDYSLEIVCNWKWDFFERILEEIHQLYWEFLELHKKHLGHTYLNFKKQSWKN